MKVKKYKHKRGAPKIVYTKREQLFYKQNKKKIIEGLKDYVPKNQIKRVFFGNVNEEKKVNKISDVEAMRKVLRSRTFTSIEENFEYYKEEVIENAFKGRYSKQTIKSYLGIPQNQKLSTEFLEKNEDGWSYNYNGKSIILQPNSDTETDGYIITLA